MLTTIKANYGVMDFSNVTVLLRIRITG